MDFDQENQDHGVPDYNPKPEIKDREDPTEQSSSLPPDPKKVSEEIDRYTSSLLNSQTTESTPSDVPIFIEQFLVLVENKIEGYVSGDSPVKWSRLTDEEAASFLEAVSRISSLSKALSKSSSDSKYTFSINRTGDILQRAMSYLEEEFKSLLEDRNIHYPYLTDASSVGYSEEVLSDLTRLSKAMVGGGYETECCQVYYVVRRNELEESLQKVGFENNCADDVHKMSWELLEKEIENRIEKFKSFMSFHFAVERKLCDIVFSGHPQISESLFIGLSSAVTIQFLNFAEAVSLTKRLPEKMFKFLDTYDAVRDVVEMIESLLTQGKEPIELKNEAFMIKTHLTEAIVMIFNEVEASIKGDLAKNAAPGGAIHPLTKHVLDYLECASVYKQSLEEVYMESTVNQRLDNEESGTQSTSPLQTQILKIMDLLDANMEAKSKLYKDSSLSSIFLMNNGRFTLKKVKRCEKLNSLLGENWYRKKTSDLRQYHKGYQRETWGKLLGCLNPEGLMVNGKIVKPLLKERYKSFNALFDEIRKTQGNWVIVDEQLQSELRVSISNMVIPAYRSFLARYIQALTPGRQMEKYVKHQPEEIEALIDGLFSGTTAPVGKKK